MSICTKHLLVIIETRGYNEEDANKLAQNFRVRYFCNSLIDDSMYTDAEHVGGSVYRFHVHDFYVIKELNFFKLLYHHIRKGFTAALRYMGIDTPVIVIIKDTSFAVMNGAN